MDGLPRRPLSINESFGGGVEATTAPYEVFPVRLGKFNVRSEES
jgi:hypothetical protein